MVRSDIENEMAKLTRTRQCLCCLEVPRYQLDSSAEQKDSYHRTRYMIKSLVQAKLSRVNLSQFQFNSNCQA